MTDSDTVPVMGCSPHFVSWRPRFCVQPTCLAGSGVNSSRACYRIRHAKTYSCWRNGCAPRLKPPPTRWRMGRFPPRPAAASQSRTMRVRSCCPPGCGRSGALSRQGNGSQSRRAFDAFGRTAVDAVARRSFRNGEWRLIWSSTVQGGGKRRGARSEYLAQLGSALFQDDRCGREREPVCTVSPACLDGS
jgi:hypothetical protein